MRLLECGWDGTNPFYLRLLLLLPWLGRLSGSPECVQAGSPAGAIDPDTPRLPFRGFLRDDGFHREGYRHAPPATRTSVFPAARRVFKRCLISEDLRIISISCQLLLQ